MLHIKYTMEWIEKKQNAKLRIHNPAFCIIQSLVSLIFNTLCLEGSFRRRTM